MTHIRGFAAIARIENQGEAFESHVEVNGALPFLLEKQSGGLVVRLSFVRTGIVAPLCATQMLLQHTTSDSLSSASKAGAPSVAATCDLRMLAVFPQGRSCSITAFGTGRVCSLLSNR